MTLFKLGKFQIHFYSLTSYLRSFSTHARCAHDPRSLTNSFPAFRTWPVHCGRRLWVYYGHSGAFHFDFIWGRGW